MAPDPTLGLSGGRVPAHILGGQERVREAGLCGELSADYQQMCIREAGHEPPHGDAISGWQPSPDFLVGLRRAVLALVQDHDATGTVRRLYQSGFTEDHEAAKIIELAQEEIANG